MSVCVVCVVCVYDVTPEVSVQQVSPERWILGGSVQISTHSRQRDERCDVQQTQNT